MQQTIFFYGKVKRISKENPKQTKKGKKKEKESSKASNHDTKWWGNKLGTPCQDCKHHLTTHHFSDDINTLE